MPTEVQALAGKRVVQVGAGVEHTVCVTEDGALYTMGDGRRGSKPSH